VKRTALVLGIPLLVGAAVLLWVAAAGRAENPGPLGFRLDDAWIHMVYGRGLLANGYLAYNDGVPSTGCTSPLWAVCLAAVHALTGGGTAAVVRAVWILGALLHLAGVAAATSLGRRLTEDDTAGALAGALVALATPVAAAAYSGMEVSLTIVLTLLALDAAAARAWRRAGVWLALAGLARPEAAVVTLLLALLAPRLAAPGARRRAAVAMLVPSVAAGLLLAAHHVWASGSPLPATFHAKSQASLAALPGRLATALREMLPGIPPLEGGVAWLALLGLLPWGRGGRADARAFLPLLAGAALLLANLLLIDPVDPHAYYHLRYLLPAVPPLLVALAVGAHALAARLHGRAAAAPATALLLLAGIGVARTAEPVSRHLHNDVRNINEVQRAIGEWLGANVPAGTWIATSDAGAVRYFSRRPVLDVLGLNTPEMLAGDESYLEAHPVAAIALLPAWFRPVGAAPLRVIHEARTERYTVTSNPRMAEQVVLASAADAPVRVRFAGYRSFAVTVLPASAWARAPAR
jgi:hypothetical protein